MNNPQNLDWQTLQMKSRFLNQDIINNIVEADYQKLNEILQNEVGPFEQNGRKKVLQYLNFEPINLYNNIADIESKLSLISQQKIWQETALQKQIQKILSNQDVIQTSYELIKLSNNLLFQKQQAKIKGNFVQEQTKNLAWNWDTKMQGKIDTILLSSKQRLNQSVKDASFAKTIQESQVYKQDQITQCLNSVYKYTYQKQKELNETLNQTQHQASQMNEMSFLKSHNQSQSALVDSLLLTTDKRRLYQNLFNDLWRTLREDNNNFIFEFLKLSIEELFKNSQIGVEENLIKTTLYILETNFQKLVQKTSKYQQLKDTSNRMSQLIGYIQNNILENKQLDSLDQVGGSHCNVPIWMICFYAIRAGMHQELLQYLWNYQYTDEDLGNFEQILSNQYQTKQQFIQDQKFATPGREVDSFKTNLQNLYQQNGDLQYMSFFSIWDYIWFYVKNQSMFVYQEGKQNSIQKLQEKVTKNQEIIGSQTQYSIYTQQQILVFCQEFEFVLAQLFQLPNQVPFAINVFFLMTEAGLIDGSELLKNHLIKKSLFGYLNKLSQKENIKVLCYFSCIVDQQFKTQLITEFILLNRKIVESVFQYNSESQKRLQQLKTFFSYEDYQLILQSLLKEKWVDSKLQNQMLNLKILEEANLTGSLLDQIFLINFQLVKVLNESIQNKELKDFQQHLKQADQLDILLQNNKEIFIGTNHVLLEQTILLQKLREILQVYLEGKSLSLFIQKLVQFSQSAINLENYQESTIQAIRTVLKLSMQIFRKELESQGKWQGISQLLSQQNQLRIIIQFCNKLKTQFPELFNKHQDSFNDDYSSVYMKLK